MSTEKFNLIFKDFPEYMKLSEKKRALWIHRSDGEGNIPKAILDSYRDGKNQRYGIDENGWFIDKETLDEKGNPTKVIRNKKTAGKPNMQRINGQNIWNGNVDRHARNKLKEFLTEYYTPTIIRHWPPLIFTQHKFFHFEFIFYVPLTLRNYAHSLDIDNIAYPYTKAFTDTLTQLKVITDDSAKYYRGFYARYVDIPSEDDKRIEIKLHFCENAERLC
jgi:hypothetical protein